jgi:hypothetical protein
MTENQPDAAIPEEAWRAEGWFSGPSIPPDAWPEDPTAVTGSVSGGQGGPTTAEGTQGHLLPMPSGGAAPQLGGDFANGLSPGGGGPAPGRWLGEVCPVEAERTASAPGPFTRTADRELVACIVSS